MKKIKTIALVAHDNRKSDIMEWVEYNYELLANHKIVCTGTTGSKIKEIFNKKAQCKDIFLPEISCLKSGPLGGDQQLGALICEGKIDILIFFWDPMQAQPHDVDVKALSRIAVLYNIPTAQNRATADFIISSQLFNEHYIPVLKDYSEYIHRDIKT